MPSLADLLRPTRCPEHPHVSIEQGACWFCTHKPETPQERNARMAEFHKRFPALGLAAVRETGRFVREDVDHDTRHQPPIYWEPRDD